jgi:hypothetical protein
LNTGDDSFVRCFHVGWNIDAVSDGWKRWTLPTKSLWREFWTLNNGFCLFGGIYLRNNNSAKNNLALIVTEGCITYCAPASKALLIKSEWVILMRTSGDTPRAAIAAVELCIPSSLIWPCSQSMIIPFFC